jgi:hypothetical protein
VIPFALPRTFGRMVGQVGQGYAILAVMATLALAGVVLTNVFELAGNATVPQAAGVAMEGEEVRFGVSDSATFAAATTLTSTRRAARAPAPLVIPRPGPVQVRLLESLEVDPRELRQGSTRCGKRGYRPTGREAPASPDDPGADRAGCGSKNASTTIAFPVRLLLSPARLRRRG